MKALLCPKFMLHLRLGMARHLVCFLGLDEGLWPKQKLTENQNYQHLIVSCLSHDDFLRRDCGAIHSVTWPEKAEEGVECHRTSNFPWIFRFQTKTIHSIVMYRGLLYFSKMHVISQKKHVVARAPIRTIHPMNRVITGKAKRVASIPRWVDSHIDPWHWLQDI